MKFVGVLCLICVRIALSHNINHWMVTETGLIQPKENSPFLMANPYDLLSFLNQDTRWQNIINIYYILIHRQISINKLWTKLEVQSKFDMHIAMSEFCQSVDSLELLDWYASYIEEGYKGISKEDYLLQKSKLRDTGVPDCKKISSLTFSMFAYEHLDGMIKRENLNATPEFALPEIFSSVMSVDQFGHWLSDILRKNSSSWLHYNLAAIYWRCKGNVPKAMECSRRAVHYVPRHFKHIALLCLGTILHRTKQTGDALIVLGAAVDHDPTYGVSHFALGEALAVSGDLNGSLKQLDMTIKLQSTFGFAEKFRNGVLCHLDMFKKIRAVQRILNKLSKEISEYGDLEHQWLKYQTAFLKTMKHDQKYDYKNIERNCIKMGEISGLKIKELKIDGDRNSLVKYFLDSPKYNEEWQKETGVKSLDIALSFQRLIDHIALHAGLPTKALKIDKTRNKTEILKEIGPMPSFPDIFPDSKLYKPHIKTVLTRVETEKIEYDDGIQGTLKADVGKQLYPTNFKVNRNREDFDKDPEWPTIQFCTEKSSEFPDEIDTIYPVFIPFENKGIKLRYLLTEKIGVPPLVEHDLPWHPPMCPEDKDISMYTQRKGINLAWVEIRAYMEILRPYLLRYLSDTHNVKNMQDAEIGQRIQTAIEKRVAPKWILYTIASLYWRVRGNNVFALNCLLTAGRTTDPQYRDLVLVSMSSVLLDMGLLDEATEKAEEAYRINTYEPATNFLLAQISMINKSPPGHMFHLKQTIRVDPRFLGGRARKILNAWSCSQMRVSTLTETTTDTDPEQNAICSQVEPGVSMVCEIGGSNCHISKRNCNAIKHESSTTAFIQMLELRDDFIRGTQDDYLDDRIFDKYMDTMSIDATDIDLHRKKLDAMLNTLNQITKGCGRKTCPTLQAEDLKLTREDCVFDELRLETWLQITSFELQMNEIVLQHAVDIMVIPPSTNKDPVCPLPSINDFFFSQMINVDAEGWGPIHNLLNEFSEVNALYDNAVLGSKIAKFVENEPTSWAGALMAGWWCGVRGNGACAVSCLANAYHLAPQEERHQALHALASLLLMQSKLSDGKDMAYLMFYMWPKYQLGAYVAGLAHTYNSEYVQAMWMYRYSLTYGDKFLPAKACLHITMCLMVYGDIHKKKANKTAV